LGDDADAALALAGVTVDDEEETDDSEAPADKITVVVHCSGGVVQGAEATSPHITIIVRDRDDIEQGDPEPKLPANLVPVY
jgi:hypothetical protein